MRHEPAYFGAIEADLVRWWRTHPNVDVKAFAAEALAKGGLEHASAVLSEGLPGANEARPVGEGPVIVPRPAMAPDIMPSTDGLRRVAHSIAAQVRAPAQAARCVAVIAMTAREFAASADPPLKPNQPTHNNPVPITASDRSNGARFSLP